MLVVIMLYFPQASKQQQAADGGKKRLDDASIRFILSRETRHNSPEIGSRQELQLTLRPLVFGKGVARSKPYPLKWYSVDIVLARRALTAQAMCSHVCMSAHR